MLFSSFEFILVFLPITLGIFWHLTKHNYYRVALGWLIFASLFFYAWWNPPYVFLLIGLTLFNHVVSSQLCQSQLFSLRAKVLLYLGVSVNLGLLGYYKYAGFLLENINSLLNRNVALAEIVLPLGISFFTFQQIAYLVDSYQGKVKQTNLLKYGLFIFFFPQLIAGPIVHYSEILPQFSRQSLSKFRGQDLAIGSTVFIIGLAKKVILADGIALTANPIFHAADSGISIYFTEAWMGGLAYALQLYFDFSGYSDMAVGVGRMLGVQLPQNFNSPYKASSIIDFWRWWHMTLSRFLKEYLYIPIGGNRYGKFARYRNLMITMLLGGLWHGASWTFVVWGGLHGIYLIINHQWRSLFHAVKLKGWLWQTVGKISGIALTFMAVTLAWVFFRSQTWSGAIAILGGMTATNGIALSQSPALVPKAYKEIVLLLGIVWLLPNTWQWMAYSLSPQYYQPPGSGLFNSQAIAKIQQKIQNYLNWKPNRLFGVIMGILFFATLKTALAATQSEFLYFDF